MPNSALKTTKTERVAKEAVVKSRTELADDMIPKKAGTEVVDVKSSLSVTVTRDDEVHRRGGVTVVTTSAIRYQ